MDANPTTRPLPTDTETVPAVKTEFLADFDTPQSTSTHEAPGTKQNGHTDQGIDHESQREPEPPAPKSELSLDDESGAFPGLGRPQRLETTPSRPLLSPPAPITGSNGISGHAANGSSPINTTQASPAGPAAKKQKQSTLNFSGLGLTAHVKDEDVQMANALHEAVHAAPVKRVSQRAKADNFNKHAYVVKIQLRHENRPATVEIVHRGSAYTPKPPAKAKKATPKLKNSTSRTTILRDKNKTTRATPGPLLALNYDLYDDNLILAPQNKAVSSEKVALGFPLKHSSSLYDIAYIIAFLVKFESLVKMGPVGPQDFEEGLGLDKKPNPDDVFSVSPTMEILFCKLLTLLLNRKKPVTKDMQRLAIQELKTKYLSLGLPAEWRDDTSIHETTRMEIDLKKDVVDESFPVMDREDTIEYEEPRELMNPFHEKRFEDWGLSGISRPRDRCIMLRCLVLWSISSSPTVKTYLASVVNKQEAPGEKDNMYGARSILKGFPHTKELKKELEQKRSKKNKSKLSTDADFSYVDPTSDPTEHPMALRLNEFIVGDCGFHIGRFYLVRIADIQTGRVASIDDMNSLIRNASGFRTSLPSAFKLFVEDVHSVLLHSLREFGVEFDSKGKEVGHSDKSDYSEYWHTVASNCEELEQFITHLEQKLGLVASEDATIPQNSVAYKPILHMAQYLNMIYPLLYELEELRALEANLTRMTRKRRVDYMDQQSLEDADYKDEDNEDDYSDGVEEDDDYE